MQLILLSNLAENVTLTFPLFKTLKVPLVSGHALPSYVRKFQLALYRVSTHVLCQRQSFVRAQKWPSINVIATSLRTST